MTLIDDINLVIRPREFVCLLGPSGSGKSTLLAILSGRSPPDAGNVTVNSEDLYNAFEALKEDIAVVPQKELVKERVIFLRERDFNLGVGGYLASKFVVLALISVAQASLLFAIVRAWCGPPGSAALQWLTLASLATAGTAVGLLISTIAPSKEVATALVPITVIPQIILGGVIAPLSGIARSLAEWFISVYWGQKALERVLPEADLMRLGREKLEWSGPLAIVSAHAAAVALSALVVLSRTRGRGRAR